MNLKVVVLRKVKGKEAVIHNIYVVPLRFNKNGGLNKMGSAVLKRCQDFKEHGYLTKIRITE